MWGARQRLQAVPSFGIRVQPVIEHFRLTWSRLALRNWLDASTATAPNIEHATYVHHRRYTVAEHVVDWRLAAKQETTILRGCLKRFTPVRVY
jgi:hypothetical protein